jgi:hypothetical protein
MMGPIVALFGLGALLPHGANASLSSDSRTAVVRPARPAGGARQLTNPRTGTTCTLLILSARPDLDPAMVRKGDARLDEGIVGPAPPCVDASEGKGGR